MIEISEAAEAMLPRLDGLLFDMDGVLIDITQSIRTAACLSTPLYLREILGWTAGDDLLTSSDIEMFKNAGGFNDDGELACALVLHYLVKERENPGTSAETLNVFQPSLSRYAARIAERGGGLDAAERICTEHQTFDDRTAINMVYRKRDIARIQYELFAGHECNEMFGFEPRTYHGEGYWKLDSPIIDVNRLDAASKTVPPKKLGILTGRTSGETSYGLRVANLEETIPMDNIVTSDNGHLKPDPTGLKQLVDRLAVTAGIYIGDTRDDFRTVDNYRKQYPDAPPMLAALVLSGPAGDANARIFRRTHADVIATDVNEVLRWVAEGSSK
jgi:HAD superfamily phosphatase